MIRPAREANEAEPHGEARRERLETRLTPEQKRVVQRAAALEGRSVSDFVVTSAMRRAEEIIRAEQVIRLTVQDSVFFAELISNPEPPNDALRAAAKLHDKLIGS